MSENRIFRGEAEPHDNIKDLPAPLHLELVEATTYATGVAIHVYRPRSSGN